jgi:hypothetical protein
MIEITKTVKLADVVTSMKFNCRVKPVLRGHDLGVKEKVAL